MKKRIATIVCLTLTITMLSACTNGNTGSDSKSTEDPKPTEEVKPTEVEEPTVTEETTPTEDPVPAKDEVVEFFYDDEIKEVAPEELCKLRTFMDYCFIRETDECEFPIPDCMMDEIADYGHSFELAYVDSETTEMIEIYLYEKPTDPVEFGTVFVLPGESREVRDFIPLIYNGTKKCVVGYWLKEGEYIFTEYYLRAGESFNLKSIEVDPKLYGF